MNGGRRRGIGRRWANHRLQARPGFAWLFVLRPRPGPPEPDRSTLAAMILEFLPEASAELYEAVLYYESKQEGLGKRFRNEVLEVTEPHVDRKNIRARQEDLAVAQRPVSRDHEQEDGLPQRWPPRPP